MCPRDSAGAFAVLLQPSVPARLLNCMGEADDWGRAAVPGVRRRSLCGLQLSRWHFRAVVCAICLGSVCAEREILGHAEETWSTPREEDISPVRAKFPQPVTIVAADPASARLLMHSQP